MGRRPAADASERPFEQRHDGVGGEVAAKDQRHVVGHIILSEKGFHIGKTGVLQILRAADNRITIATASENKLLSAFHQAASEIVGGPVFLFIYRFKLALKQPKDGLHEAFAVEGAPLTQVLRRKLAVIDGFIKARKGVDATAPVMGEQFGELIGNSVNGRLPIQLVDFLLNMSTLL